MVASPAAAGEAAGAAAGKGPRELFYQTRQNFLNFPSQWTLKPFMGQLTAEQSLSHIEILIQSKSLSEFLERFIDSKKQSRPGFSMRSFASKLGYNSPSLLSDIVNGKRKASEDFLDRLSQYLSLNSLESRYLKNLVKIQNLSDQEEMRETLVENNKCIREVLLGPIVLHENLEPLDLLFIEHLRQNQRVSEKDFYFFWNDLFTTDECRQRVEKLQNLKIIEIEKQQITFLKLPKRFSFQGKDFKSLLDVLSQLIDRDQIKSNSILVSSLSSEDFKLAENYLMTAYNQIAMLAQASEEKKTAEDAKIRVFSSHYFSL